MFWGKVYKICRDRILDFDFRAFKFLEMKTETDDSFCRQKVFLNWTTYSFLDLENIMNGRTYKKGICVVCVNSGVIWT